MTVSNTGVGQLSAIPMAIGGVGAPATSFLLMSQYTSVCNGATAVTVVDAGVTAQSVIIITLGTVGGTVGVQPHVVTITPGTGFTWVGTASDTSTYNILRIG
jgi:hypothetical protein